MRFLFAFLVSGALFLGLLTSCHRQDETSRPTIRIATTTSTRDSGLMDVLIPVFEEQERVHVQLIAVGTGKALELGRRGEVDALLVHSEKQEIEFMKQEHGVRREPVMFNHFVLLGPADDPAGVQGKNVIDAFHSIRRSQAQFVSRGDNSGTHARESDLWNQLESQPQWAGYMETGQGMGASLLIADQKAAYVLCDQGTYLSMKSKIKLVPIASQNRQLENRYSVISVNPQKNDRVQLDLADRFIAFLTSPATMDLIESFRVNEESLFHPLRSDHKKSNNKPIQVP